MTSLKHSPDPWPLPLTPGCLSQYINIKSRRRIKQNRSIHISPWPKTLGSPLGGSEKAVLGYTDVVVFSGRLIAVAI